MCSLEGLKAGGFLSFVLLLCENLPTVGRHQLCSPLNTATAFGFRTSHSGSFMPANSRLAPKSLSPKLLGGPTPVPGVPKPECLVENLPGNGVSLDPTPEIYQCGLCRNINYLFNEMTLGLILILHLPLHSLQFSR